MQAYQQGDVEAFEVLYGRYRDRVYGYFARTFGDRELSADLFQRTFLRLHQGRSSYDPRRPFRTWLFSIAVNLGKDELKRRARRPGDTPGEELSPVLGIPSGTPSPEATLLATERARHVEQALARLPEPQREVIVLHKLEGLSFPEIAKMRGEKVEAVKARAFRGYQSLRKLLGERWQA